MTSKLNADNGVSSGTAGLKQSADSSGILELQTNGVTAATVSTGQVFTFAQPASLPNTFGFKNRIINGAMVIDQRNAGASVSNAAATAAYTLDRWWIYGTVATKFTCQQNAGSVTPPTGFINYLGITSSAATTPAATDIYAFSQKVEGLNVFDLAWGTASASAITLSFWVRSSLTGTFGGSLSNSAANRAYVFSYTISATNTWEQKTITIPGDTTGTWLTTNGTGIQLYWDLGSGTSQKTTAGSWGSTFYYGPTGGTNTIGTSGATFYITGVQLEKGATATSFDYRPYGTELALCQRYFFTCNAFNYNTNAYYQGYYGGSAANFNIRYPVQMRATPTATISQPTQVQYYSQSGIWTNTTITVQSYNGGSPNYNAGTTDITIGANTDSIGNGKLLYLTGGAATTLPTVSISAEL